MLRWFGFASAVLVLSACAQETNPPPQRAAGVFKVGKPYQVAGQWYYPKVDYAYKERGLASWYGPNFHGKPTANGEIFDMEKISAAHKTLPLPSVVRVTNLQNGRSLEVRINDRGPFIRGRIIDLSKKAAELLGFEDQGTAPVEVELLVARSREEALALGAAAHPAFGPAPPKAAPSVEVTVENLGPLGGVEATGRGPENETEQPMRVAATEPVPNGSRPPFDGVANVGSRAEAPAPLDSGNRDTTEPGSRVDVVPVEDRPTIYIQAGAFARYDNANRLRARLGMLGFPVRVHQVYISNQPMFRVRVGPLKTVEDADHTLDRLVATGYPDAQIVID